MPTKHSMQCHTVARAHHPFAVGCDAETAHRVDRGKCNAAFQRDTEH